MNYHDIIQPNTFTRRTADSSATSERWRPSSPQFVSKFHNIYQASSTAETVYQSAIVIVILIQRNDSFTHDEL